MPETQAVVFVVDDDALPIVEPQVVDHPLLPRLLLGRRDVGKDLRDRDRLGEPLATGDVDGDGKDGRRVASTREGDAARWALQRLEDDELERPARVALAARRPRQSAVVTGDDARGDLERAHHVELLVPGHRR